MAAGLKRRGLTRADIPMIEGMIRDCGDSRVSLEYPFVRSAFFYGNCEGEALGDVGFYLCRGGGKTIRLYFLVVRGRYHGLGHGKTLLRMLMQRAITGGVDAITMRTAIDGSAIGFWMKYGASIVGLKGGDYELVMRVRA